MTRSVTLRSRLHFLGIDDDTRQNLRLFHPVLRENLEGVIAAFYKHVLAFPETREILTGPEMVKRLHQRQKQHWLKLFWGDFDEAYQESAILIGQQHYKHRVPPYLYIAAYNFFLCELIKLASAHYGASLELPGILASIARTVNLDMDLALSAYTREFWTRAA